MDSSKIKNFVICLLAAVNLVFLILVISDSSQGARLQRQLEADLSAVLAENGVTLDEKVLPATQNQQRYSLTRNLEAEADLSAALLGPAQGEDQGGNIYSYETESGCARFRGSGEFEITFTAPLAQDGQTEEEAAAQVLKHMGLQVAPGFSRFESGEEYILQTLCTVDEQPVYNCTVYLHFSPDGLISISGRRPTGNVRAEGATEMNPTTALFTLLSYAKDSGQSFSRVTGLKSGFSLSISVSGGAELSPVWQVSTDAGEFYVNPETRSVSFENL